MKPERLSEDVIQQKLASLPGWRVEGAELVREFQFPSYLAGIAFVQDAAQTAEAMNHHPDMGVGWRKVTVRITTHSASGLTALDFDLAARITNAFH